MRLAAIASVFAIAFTAAACTSEEKPDDRPTKGSTKLSAQEFCDKLETAEAREKMSAFQKDIAAIAAAGVVRDVPSEVRAGFELYAGLVEVVFEKKALPLIENDVSELEGLQLAAYHTWINEECGLPLVTPEKNDPIPAPGGEASTGVPSDGAS